MSFKHPLLVNWNIEIICSPFEDDIFSYANQSQKEKQSGNNADAVLNDFTDLESKSTKIIFDAYFLG